MRSSQQSKVMKKRKSYMSCMQVECGGAFDKEQRLPDFFSIIKYNLS